MKITVDVIRENDISFLGVFIKLFFTLFMLTSFIVAKESDDININLRNYSLYENQIKVDLDKNTKIFKKSFQSKLTNVGEIDHSLVNVYEVNKHNLLFLINSNTLDNICHVCLPRMSWYNLKFENNKWNIKDKILSIEPDYGSWGSFPTPEMISIGKDKIAFKYVSSYGGQGQFETHLDLVEYVDANFKFKSILSLDYGFSDTGYYPEGEEHNDWEGNILIIKKDKPYYDILISKKGKKDKKEYEENQIYMYQKGRYILDKN